MPARWRRRSRHTVVSYWCCLEGIFALQMGALCSMSILVAGTEVCTNEESVASRMVTTIMLFGRVCIAMIS